MTLPGRRGGASPVLAPDRRRQFEQALAWLIAGEEDDRDEFVAAVEAACRRDQLLRSQWSRVGDDDGKLVEVLVRRGPAGLDDRLLCHTLLSETLPDVAIRVMLNVLQDASANRLWARLENDVGEARAPIDEYLETLTDDERDEYCRH